MKKIPALLLRSFIKGLIILCPTAFTAYIIWLIFSKVDGLLLPLLPYKLIPHIPPGLGFAVVILSIVIIGFLGTKFFLGKALVDFFDHLLEHTPGIKYIYSSIKDFVSSFVGDKKKFGEPVWVRVNETPEVWRIGFLTQHKVDGLGIDDKVAVYLPHSYAISGWVIIIDKYHTKPVTTMTAAEAMKFAVSGGISNRIDSKA